MRPLLLNCRAVSGTDVFLSAGMGGLKNIRLIGNFLNGAQRQTEEENKNYWTIIQPSTEE
jgi:hypothetical protein